MQSYFITYQQLFNGTLLEQTLFFLDEGMYKKELRKWKRREGDMLFTRVLNYGEYSVS